MSAALPSPERHTVGIRCFSSLPMLKKRPARKPHGAGVLAAEDEKDRISRWYSVSIIRYFRRTLIDG
jgi:hypothetical protein